MNLKNTLISCEYRLIANDQSLPVIHVAHPTGSGNWNIDDNSNSDQCLSSYVRDDGRAEPNTRDSKSLGSYK